ncbi:hypothetical protein EKG83_38055 [Saccharothrix syringae]|uniref:Integrase catalytic domain-containing protein n=1 Tax=Saccharothrix syringae TaxID=103733 RepID=A0A5Q0HEN9_SACSY|nr:hypothetical protein EKG83_38055 [Saccharothrix syringae]
MDFHGDWKNATGVTLAMMEWVAWYNSERLHSFCGNSPSVEYEEKFHRTAVDTGTAV